MLLSSLTSHHITLEQTNNQTNKNTITQQYTQPDQLKTGTTLLLDLHSQ